MQEYEPQNKEFEKTIRESFAKQNLMQAFGAKLISITPGAATIELPYRDDLTQQHGYLHAGVITAIIDSACGYAALSLMPQDMEVMSAEYKINLLSPADGEKLVARGTVLKPGRKLYVVRGDAYSARDGKEKHVAAFQGTMVAVRKKD
ncbi:MAG: PaaI family thioesterase [candidate division Zixibacteria bacterium]|nr:PaaI family thioesterase [candidate division Zixibacteria bacterium]NIR66169.1 PaaI family thioesterase [candidate division Zixibacteria bacterium]NIS17249.1 PaaI family thioesterase [candidate division Zixibacteria bacterium]NIS47792.1 PaaI family thioesterase [candidate division Zixibacteria bacterium]NIT53606.1 PaaI family thioesterase [candidate division Zixibacteria bacterium]